MNTVHRLLESHDACYEALCWAETLDHDDLARAWATCPRGDWMLWIAARVDVNRRALVFAACACARIALPSWEERYPNDARPRTAIETAEGWARGEATIDEVRVARQAAWTAAYATADYDAATAAAAAAATAAATADYDAYATYAAAAYAASAVASTAYTDASTAVAVQASVLARCADEVRRTISWPMMARALGVLS